MSTWRRLGTGAVVVLLMLMLRPALAQSAEPLQAGRQAAITSTGDGPYFRLNLPITLYPSAAHVDLRDVRIRNAGGEWLAFAWLHNETTETQILSTAAAFYPISIRRSGDTTRQTDLTLDFKQNRDGTLLTIESKRPVATPENSDLIIDASRIRGRLLQARFVLDENAEGLFPLSLEASDDLRHWRSVSSSEQIAVLRHAGQKVEKLQVELNGIGAKFLRMNWQGQVPVGGIKSVSIDSLQQDTVLTPLQWSPPIQAAVCAEDYCDYPLPANTPLDSVRINLSEPNTLAAVTISAPFSIQAASDYPRHRNPLYVLRHKRQAPATTSTKEVLLAKTVAYRLKYANGEVSAENLAMDGGVYTRLRLQIQGPISLLGKAAPSIEVATMPRSLIFLARGTPPFTLHWGIDDQRGTALTLATLVPGYQPGTPIAATLATVDIPPTQSLRAATSPASAGAQVIPQEAPIEARKLWLWAALTVGLLLLGAMAWSLFRSMAKPEQDE